MKNLKRGIALCKYYKTIKLFDYFNASLMYTITISQSALKELHSLQKQTVQKIGKSINSLIQNPRPADVKKLKGSSEDLYRIRSGDYRIIYSIQDEIRIVDIRKIGHRKDIYK